MVLETTNKSMSLPTLVDLDSIVCKCPISLLLAHRVVIAIESLGYGVQIWIFSDLVVKVTRRRFFSTLFDFEWAVRIADIRQIGKRVDPFGLLLEITNGYKIVFSTGEDRDRVVQVSCC